MPDTPTAPKVAGGPTGHRAWTSLARDVLDRASPAARSSSIGASGALPRWVKVGPAGLGEAVLGVEPARPGGVAEGPQMHVVVPGIPHPVQHGRQQGPRDAAAPDVRVRKRRPRTRRGSSSSWRRGAAADVAIGPAVEDWGAGGDGVSPQVGHAGLRSRRSGCGHGTRSPGLRDAPVGERQLVRVRRRRLNPAAVPTRRSASPWSRMGGSIRSSRRCASSCSRTPGQSPCCTVTSARTGGRLF